MDGRTALAKLEEIEKHYIEQIPTSVSDGIRTMFSNRIRSQIVRAKRRMEMLYFDEGYVTGFSYDKGFSVSDNVFRGEFDEEGINNHIRECAKAVEKSKRFVRKGI